MLSVSIVCGCAVSPLSEGLILTHILQSDRIKDEHVRRRGVISLVVGVQPTDVKVVKAVPYLLPKG